MADEILTIREVAELLNLNEKTASKLASAGEILGFILLAREAHFPATIADFYEVKDGESKMPADLREAHERNDAVLERIYIGRRFRNDTERAQRRSGRH